MKKIDFRKVRILIIGFGWYSKIHIAALRQFDGLSETASVEIVGLIPSRTDGKKKAEEMGYVGFDTAEEAAAAIKAGELEVDYVLVVTPNAFHEENSVPFLEIDVPVYCEKPLADRLDGAERMAEASLKTGTLLGSNYTYLNSWPATVAWAIITYGRLKGEQLDQFALEYEQGYERGAEEAQDDPLVWRRGQAEGVEIDPDRDSNVEGDLVPHLGALLSYLTGTSISAVSAMRWSVLKDRPLPDNAEMLCHTGEGGPKGRITVSQTKFGKGNPPKVSLGFPTAGIEFELGEGADMLTIIPKGRGPIRLRCGDALGDEPWLAGLDEHIAEALAIMHYPDQHHWGLNRWLMIGHIRFWKAVNAVVDSEAGVNDLLIGGSGTGALGLYLQRLIQAGIISGNNDSKLTKLAT